MGTVNATDVLNNEDKTTIEGISGKRQNANVTVTVGATGDYTTIRAALTHLTKAYTPIFINGGFLAEVKLLSGFVMSEQILVTYLDLGWITITGEDAETTITRSSLTTVFGSASKYPPFGASKNARLPVISQLFNMDTSGTATNRDGIYLDAASKCVVSNGAGVKNAGWHGAYISNSSILEAANSIFTGAGQIGVYAIYNSEINADTVDVDNAGGLYGVYSYYSSKINFSNGSAVLAGTTNATKAENMSSINAIDSNSATNGAGDEYNVTKGSVIEMNGALGGTATSQTVNTLTLNGIIYQ